MERSKDSRRKDLGQFLRDGAFIKPEKLKEAQQEAERTKTSLAQVLVDGKFITFETRATAYASMYNVPLIDLGQHEIQPEALALVTEDVARKHNVLPLSIVDGGSTLKVAMDDPGDIQAVTDLNNLTRKIIQIVVPLRGGILAAIDSHYRLVSQLSDQINQIVEAVPSIRSRGNIDPVSAQGAVSGAPVVKAVELIIAQAVKDRASDIHIEPGEKNLTVRYRIDGVLQPAVTLELGVHAAILSRIKVMANMNIAERRRPQDGQFSATIMGRPIDFRVATAETICGEKMVIRILDKTISVTDLPGVGFSAQLLETVRRMLGSPFGMILVSGPTGSGKTTTLYAGLRELDPKTKNISTIEDPVEYRFDGINQIQVNPQAEITFAIGLRALMRMDPDIILVGEIRDQETANVAVQAALTGHLVLSSIHANDAVGAVVRLINLGVEPFLVTSAVIATLSQRLVRKVCPYCHTLGPVSSTEAMAYQAEMVEVRKDFYFGSGCNFCSRTGFLGRTAVIEMLPISDQVRQLINRQAPATEIKTQALRDGMVTMRRDGMLKARDGITTPGEIIRNVYIIG